MPKTTEVAFYDKALIARQMANALQPFLEQALHEPLPRRIAALLEELGAVEVRRRKCDGHGRALSLPRN